MNTMFRNRLTDETATFEFRILNSGETTTLVGRAFAEECLRLFAQGGGYDIHLHPAATYTDSARSTAYTRGGDMLLDAVASLRRLF